LFAYSQPSLTAVSRVKRDPASEAFTAHLRSAFGSATAHNIEFPNPYTRSTSVNSVYIAQNDR
jgi:hypothetical protein